MVCMSRTEVFRRALSVIVLGGVAALAVWLGGRLGDFGADFAMFYTAADLADEGRWESVYDVDKLGKRYSEITGRPLGEAVPTYGYPPILAQVLRPVTRWIPVALAAALFVGLGLGLALVQLRWLGLDWRGVTWFLIFFPTVYGLYLGQNSLFTFAIVAGFVRLMLKERPLSAGLMLGLLVYKPQMLAALGLFLLCSPWRHRRAIVGAATSGVAIVLVSLILDPEGWRAFPQGLRNLLEVSGNGFRVAKSSALDFAFLWLGERTVLGLGLGMLLIGLGVWWFVVNRGENDLERELAAGILLACWVNPWMFLYEWVLLAIPAVYVMSNRLIERSRALLIYVAAAVVTPFSIPLAADGVISRGWAIQWSLPLLAISALVAFRREGSRSLDVRGM